MQLITIEIWYGIYRFDHLSYYNLWVLTRKTTEPEVARGITISSDMDLMPGMILFAMTAHIGNPNKHNKMSIAPWPTEKLSTEIKLLMISLHSLLVSGPLDLWNFCKKKSKLNWLVLRIFFFNLKSDIQMPNLIPWMLCLVLL
jgi:hypothetical protein